MERKLIILLVTTILFTGLFCVAFRVEKVRASGTIYIRADGSIGPLTANITSLDNVTYTFTDNNYDEIVVERSNIIIDGAGYRLQGVGLGNGIDLHNMLNITITNLEIKAFLCGIHFYNSSKNTIYGNTITDSADSGIYIEYYSNNNNISGNTMTTNPCSMRVHESFDNKILGNNITNNNCGIILFYSNYTIISGNSITENLNDVCIELAWASYNAFSGNNISNNYGNIGLQESFNNTFSGNNISSNGGGINLYVSSNNTFSGNTVAFSGYCGLIVHYSPNNTFTDNVITNNTGDGIRLYYHSNNNIFYRNEIRNNVGGLLLEGSGNVLRNNSMIGNRYNFGTENPIQDIDLSNTVDGKPICYWINASDKEVPSNAGYVALVKSTNITVNGLELKNNLQGILLVNTSNSQITNSKITNTDKGIIFQSSNNNTIHENNITNNKYYGIIFIGSSYNTLSGNTIRNNDNVGVYWQESSFNDFHGNNLTNNDHGILLGYSSNHNQIRANKILNNTEGVRLYGTYGLSSNTVSENTLSNNTVGIYLFPYYTSNQKIYHNNFINNSYQVFLDQDEIFDPNLWDDNYPSGGNYWSDYSATDTKSGPNQNQLGSDGIGDLPYVIDANNFDRYPLMSPWPSGPSLHELEVTLTAPRRLPPGNSTLLEATVKNNGLNNETDVSLFLFVNNTIVNSTTIPSLRIGSSYTINHSWAAMNEGYANATVYATPVPGEIFVANNRKTGIVLISSKLPVQNINTGLYYETIQEAIDASETLEGHMIEANVGLYCEHLTISKSLKIVGKDKAITIIDGNKTGTFVVHITANNVVLSGFTIQNSNIAPTPAVRIDSSHNLISNNTIIHNGWGIYVFNVYNNTIQNNIVTYNVYGIYLEWASTHTVRNNTIANQQEASIYLRESRTNIFTNNVVENNKDAIVLVRYSNYNKFYHNNFIDNTSPGFAIINSDDNSWDNHYPSGGNYWSDYTGNDFYSGPYQNETGSDGIGDTFYTNWPDRYPLKNSIGSSQSPIAIFIYNPEDPLVDKITTFNATSSYDRDGSIISYKWNFDDGNVTTTTEPIITHAYTTADTYTLNLTVTDNNGLNHSATKSITVKEDLTSPTTLHDYDDLWHTTDFTINLTATDDMSGVAETYYKINDGPVQNVSTHGQPLINTVSTNNTLEYWSVDNVDNEELPHKILTGIKLDKTVPSIDVPSREPEGNVQPDIMVKVSVNVTDTTSTVQNVILHYTINNGTTWEEPTPMNLSVLTGLYEASIPPQQADTWVRFKIVAYDYAGNNATLDGIEPYCVYQVIPEFPSLILLPLFMAITLLVALAYRRKNEAKLGSFTSNVGR